MKKMVKHLITEGAKTAVEQSSVISEHYHGMMDFATMRGIVVQRLRVMLLLDAIGDGRKVKKHRKRLLDILAKIRELDNTDLTHQNRMKTFLQPMKQIRLEFEHFVKNSLKNVLSEKEIRRVLVKANNTGKLIADEAEANGTVVTEEDLKKVA